MAEILKFRDPDGAEYRDDYEELNPDLPELFAGHGYGTEALLPMENVTKKLF